MNAKYEITTIISVIEWGIIYRLLLLSKRKGEKEKKLQLRL